jgi:hypothetical protein
MRKGMVDYFQVAHFANERVAGLAAQPRYPATNVFRQAFMLYYIGFYFNIFSGGWIQRRQPAQ